MSEIYDELRAAVERQYEAGRCTRRWRNDARTAINALQRFAPNAANLADLEDACTRFRETAPASDAVRVAYSGRVLSASNLHRGAPTERWPEGAQVQIRLKMPSKMREAVRALAEQRGCAVLDVIRGAIQAELDAQQPARAARGRTRKKSAQIS